MQRQKKISKLLYLQNPSFSNVLWEQLWKSQCYTHIVGCVKRLVWHLGERGLFISVTFALRRKAKMRLVAKPGLLWLSSLFCHYLYSFSRQIKTTWANYLLARWATKACVPLLNIEGSVEQRKDHEVWNQIAMRFTLVYDKNWWYNLRREV